MVKTITWRNIRQCITKVYFLILKNNYLTRSGKLIVNYYYHLEIDYLLKSKKAMCPWYKPGFFADHVVTF